MLVDNLDAAIYSSSDWKLSRACDTNVRRGIRIFKTHVGLPKHRIFNGTVIKRRKSAQDVLPRLVPPNAIVSALAKIYFFPNIE